MSLARAPQCHSSWQIAQHSNSSLISARTVRRTATWTGHWLTKELPAVQTQAGAAWKVSLVHQSPFNPPTPAVAPQQRERPLVCHTSVTQLGQMCVRACVYTWPSAPVFSTPASTANKFSAENLLLLTQDLTLRFSYLTLNWCHIRLGNKKINFFHVLFPPPTPTI